MLVDLNPMSKQLGCEKEQRDKAVARKGHLVRRWVYLCVFLGDTGYTLGQGEGQWEGKHFKYRLKA